MIVAFFLNELIIEPGWLLFLGVVVLPGAPGGTAHSVSGPLNIWEEKKTNVWDGMFPNKI